MVIQTAGLISLFQKPIKTAAALSSAGNTITQLYLGESGAVSCEVNPDGQVSYQ